MNKAQVLWSPSEELLTKSAMAQFLEDVRQEYPQVTDYPTLHQWSVDDVEAFWKRWLKDSGVLHGGDASLVYSQDDTRVGGRFFPDVALNFAQNLLRHQNDAPAIYAISECRSDQRLTHKELYEQVRRVQGKLIELGVAPGDRVAGILPNIPEAVVAMLAATSLGAIWSSCSPDFGTQGVLKRFEQIKPKVLFAANGYRYGGKDFSCVQKLSQITSRLDSLEAVVMVNYLGSVSEKLDIPSPVYLWDAFVNADTDHELEFAQLPFNHPLYILYSSGTTGIPKCIVHGAGGTLLQHTKELMLHSDVRPGDNVLYFTTCGWMMWNWLVSTLYAGAAITLFDGSPAHPHLGRLWEVAANKKVTHLGTSPKYIGSCRGSITPNVAYDLEALRVVFSTGAPLLDEDFDWIYSDGAPHSLLASISGGTDIISCFMLGNPLLPVYRGEIQAAGLGMDIAAFNESGQAVYQEKGELVCRKPFASMPVSFWDDAGDAKYKKAYFSGESTIWCHGDYISITQTQGQCGGVVVYGRSDATLNPGGVRIGTAEIYSLVESLAWVEDSIVVGQDFEGDVRVVLFIKPIANESLTPDRISELKRYIRTEASPRHVPAFILETEAIPYTLSGKKVELAIKEILAGQEPRNREALSNPESLDLYKGLTELG